MPKQQPAKVVQLPKRDEPKPLSSEVASEVARRVSSPHSKRPWREIRHKHVKST